MAEALKGIDGFFRYAAWNKAGKTDEEIKDAIAAQEAQKFQASVHRVEDVLARTTGEMDITAPARRRMDESLKTHEALLTECEEWKTHLEEGEKRMLMNNTKKINAQAALITLKNKLRSAPAELPGVRELRAMGKIYGDGCSDKSSL